MVRQEKKRIVFAKIYWILYIENYRSRRILNDEKPAIDSLL